MESPSRPDCLPFYCPRIPPFKTPDPNFGRIGFRSFCGATKENRNRCDAICVKKTVHKNVYHAYFRSDTEHFYGMDDIDLGREVLQDEMDAHYLVFDSGPRWTIRWPGLAEGFVQLAVR